MIFKGPTLATPLLRGLLPAGVVNVNDANFVLRRGLAEGRQTKSMKNPTVRAADLSSAQKCTGKQSEKDSTNN
jgi:hypothetical protein